MIECAVIQLIYGAMSLLVQRSLDDEHFPGTFCLPGGKLDPGETAEQAIVREIHEELGTMISKHCLLRLGEVSNDRWRTQVFRYMAPVHPVNFILDRDENVGIGWFDAATIRNLPIAGFMPKLIENGWL